MQGWVDGSLEVPAAAWEMLAQLYGQVERAAENAEAMLEEAGLDPLLWNEVLGIPEGAERLPNGAESRRGSSPACGGCGWAWRLRELSRFSRMRAGAGWLDDPRWRYIVAVCLPGVGMGATAKRKTSLTLDAALLESARDLGINVSAVADAALRSAVADARRSEWLQENADAFAAQADWHERNGHPLAEIISAPASASWKS